VYGDTASPVGRIPRPRATIGPQLSAAARSRPGAGWLSRDDRAALGLWAAAHAALLVLVWAAAWTFRAQQSHAPLTAAFEHWDASWFQNVAQFGYLGPHSMANSIGYLPGYPLAVAAAHVLLRNWVLAELAVSAIAGCFAVVSLARLAGGRRAVLYLLAMPAAIFLMVGYSECLFLAFAIPAWRAGSRGRWWTAGLLAAGAGLVRPDALFLIPALVIMALTGPAGSRVANAARASLGFAGPAAYELYLIAITGRPDAWLRAEKLGWGLHLRPPLQTLKTTWWAAFEHPFSAATAFEFQLELAAMATIIVAALAFGYRQRWAEATYCGLAAIALGTSTWYAACPRTLLVLFPVCVALAALEAGRPWIRYAYFGVSLPIAVVLGLSYLAGQWAG
jgi:hypothetical protein